MLEIRCCYVYTICRSFTTSSSTNVIVKGRRLVEVNYFFNQIKKFEHHDLFSCSIEHLQITKERRVGLQSSFIIKCEMCNKEESIHANEDKRKMNVNTSAVNAIISTGGSFAQLAEIISILNIPCMSPHLYQKEQKYLAEKKCRS